jgi:hypothetical protein
MLENTSIFEIVLFTTITTVTLLLFYAILHNSSELKVRNKAGLILICMVVWAAIQASFTLNDVYNTDLSSMPPKLALFGLLPNIIIILVLFNTKRGKKIIDSLPVYYLTLLHIIRIPVEIGLWILFIHKSIPQIMTFEGFNFDIFAGISAPLIAYFAFVNKKLSRNLVLLWNFISVALLLNIVVIALLSAPSPIQQFGFSQPNLAILNFPFSWLPTIIVPIVLFCHLATIRKVWKEA